MYIGGVPVAKHHSMFPGIADTTESLNVNVGAAKRQRNDAQFTYIPRNTKNPPREAHVNLKRRIWPIYAKFSCTQFKSCDDLFGRFALSCLYILPCNHLLAANLTLVTCQMNHHLVLNGWQRRYKLHPSRQTALETLL